MSVLGTGYQGVSGNSVLEVSRVDNMTDYLLYEGQPDYL